MLETRIPHHDDILEEPLLQSAPLAKRIAPFLCRRDPGSGQSCARYHGVWQYFRGLGLVRTPQQHAAFFHDALQSLARSGAYARVVVSGCADYSMLAHVLWVYRTVGQTVEATAVDICDTPLLLCRWYAAGQEAMVNTCCTDILRYDPGGVVDVVCTHSFLGEFSAEDRPHLFEKWHALLRQGGKVITVNRIRPHVAGSVDRYTTDQARAFQERAVARATAMRDQLGVDPVEIAQWARTYTDRHWTYPVRSVDEVADLFTRSGFIVEQCEVLQVRSGDGTGPSGPSASGQAEYVQVVASRR